jgi:hypothetical protein
MNCLEQSHLLIRHERYIGRVLVRKINVENQKKADDGETNRASKGQ